MHLYTYTVPGFCECSLQPPCYILTASSLPFLSSKGNVCHNMHWLPSASVDCRKETSYHKTPTPCSFPLKSIIGFRPVITDTAPCFATLEYSAGSQRQADDKQQPCLYMYIGWCRTDPRSRLPFLNASKPPTLTHPQWYQMAEPTNIRSHCEIS